MTLRKLSAPLILFSFVIILTGCRSNGTQPANPFAQGPRTVLPPATFSSQESYFGQTPGAGTFVPQPPASTFPSSGAVSPTQPVTSSPASIPSSDTTNSISGEQGATLFTTASRETSRDAGWKPVEVTSTSKTAFQIMETKGTAAHLNEIPTDIPESLIVGTTYVVTTIVDETQR